MSFKPETRKAIDHYAAMPAEARMRELKAMQEIRGHLDKCIAAALRANHETSKGSRK